MDYTLTRQIQTNRLVPGVVGQRRRPGEVGLPDAIDQPEGSWDGNDLRALDRRRPVPQGVTGRR